MNDTSTSRFFSIKHCLQLVFLLLAILVVAVIYFNWGHILVYIVDFQKQLHALLAKHIQQVAKYPEVYGWSLIGLSFGYGVFHAIGPGHGKAVIVTYLGTQKETIKNGIFISFLAALLQSLIAITLISILVLIMNFKFADVKTIGEDITLASYLLVALLGLFVTLSSIRKLYVLYREHHASKFHTEHAHQCGCNHAHSPKSKLTIFQTFMVIMSMGLRPCSGALVVLIYAQLVNAYLYGIIATLFMGLGTGLSISLIALSSIYARKWLEHVSETPESFRWSFPHASIYINLAGGGLLLVIGWGLFSTASKISSAHPLL